MPIYAKEAGAKLIIINVGAASMDESADVLIDMDVGKVLLRIIEGVKNKLA
jgi:NAD-dependent SIR2 family protein deacetylase